MNTALTRLELRDNRVGDDGDAALAKVLALKGDRIDLEWSHPFHYRPWVVITGVFVSTFIFWRLCCYNGNKDKSD